jgi:DNA-binding LacI/PurR family transcriptional regulator
MVIVAAPTFKSIIHTNMCEHFMKLFRHDEMMLQSLTDDPAEQKKKLRSALVQSRPSGIIAMDIRIDPETMQEFTALKIPVVLIDEEVPGASMISVDNFKGGCMAADHLAGIGRKKIAIVSGRMGIEGGYCAEQRFKGFQKTLKSKKVTIPSGGIIEVPHYSYEDGLMVMPELLRIGVDAIFCAAGDDCAQGLLAVAKERKVRVPKDIAIIGFDDLMIARNSNPPLTTIRQPLEKIAEAAYDMAVQHGEEILVKPRNIVFEPELIIRQSA